MFILQLLFIPLLLFSSVSISTAVIFSNTTTANHLGDNSQRTPPFSAFLAPPDNNTNTIMKVSEIHSKYFGITGVDGRENCPSFKKVHVEVEWEALVEPADRDAFLHSFRGFEINHDDWINGELKKKKATQLLTLYAFFTREDVEQFCSRTGSSRREKDGSRPAELEREPASGNSDIATSLGYANHDYTPDLHGENVTITEKDHPIHVLHTLDVLAWWDVVSDTVNFIRANPGKICKFGKSLHDLVLARYKNKYMYTDASKLDDSRIYDKERARISTIACANSRATGNTEGGVAFLLNVFEVGANKRIEQRNLV